MSETYLRKACGLKNGSNTCFINAAIQLLFGSVRWVETVSSASRWCSDVPLPTLGKRLRSRDLGPRRCVGSKDVGDERKRCLRDYAVTVDDYFDPTTAWLSPDALTDRYAKLSTDYSAGDQGDAHECLIKFLDDVYDLIRDVCGADGAVAAEYRRSVHLDVETAVSCERCGHCVRTNLSYPVVSLNFLEDARSDEQNRGPLGPLGPSGGYSQDLSEMLVRHFEEERLEDWRCEKCGVLEARHRQTIKNLPTEWFIHVNRFRTSDVSGTTQVFKDESTLRVYGTMKIGVYDYDLRGAVVHHGSIGNGHYVAYRCIDGRWFLIDDRHVRHASIVDVPFEKSYLLHYVRKPVDSAD